MHPPTQYVVNEITMPLTRTVDWVCRGLYFVARSATAPITKPSINTMMLTTSIIDQAFVGRICKDNIIMQHERRIQTLLEGWMAIEEYWDKMDREIE